MTLSRLRHLDYGPDVPLTEVGAAGIQALLDGGDVDAWRPVLVAIRHDPWGPVAERVDRVVDHLECPGTACAVRAWLRRCRGQLEHPPAGLAALRRERGVSQQELAVRLGTSQAQVARTEAAANPTVRSLARYLDALDVPLVGLAVSDRDGLRLVSPPGADAGQHQGK